MPGNRAIAYGPRDRLRAGPRWTAWPTGSLAPFPASAMLVALALIDPAAVPPRWHRHPPRAAHGARCRSGRRPFAHHPLRGRGYDHDVPLLTGRVRHHRAGHRLRAHRAGAWRGGFRARAGRTGSRCRKRSGRTARMPPWVPMFAGQPRLQGGRSRCRRGAGGGRRAARHAGKLVHSYPHSWRSKAPLIYRATPQWFIRMDGPEQIRARALAAIDAHASFVPPTSGPQPHRLHGRRPAGLVHQPPARLGRADPGVRRPCHRRAAA